MKIKEQLFVVKDFESRPDDKWCLCGTKKALTEALASKFECSISIRELEEIPDSKTLFWVEFDRVNWAGCGGGSSNLFTNLGDAQKWIIEKIKEWHTDIGEVKFSIYPVYRVSETELNITNAKVNKARKDRR